jgi:CheY-like chemotaxis protein/HPt (histidine-containing phosphotransfer) domain-containing protein
MSRLGYPATLALLGALFVLAVGLALYSLLPRLQTEIRFTRKEIVGVAYLQPAGRLLEHAAQARLLARRYAAGDVKVRPALLSEHAAIDADIEALAALDREPGAGLDTYPDLGLLQENWRFLRQKALALDPANTVELHTQLLQEVRRFIVRVGHTSNLTLDPRLRTSCLADVALRKLPAAQEQLADARLLAAGLGPTGNVGAGEQARLAVLDGMLVSGAAETRESLDLAFRQDPTGQLRTRLEAPRQAYLEAVAAAVKVLRHDGKAVSPDFDAALAHALDAAFRLGDETARELDGRLRADLRTAAARRDLIAGAACVFLLLVSYLLLALRAAVARTSGQAARAGDGSLARTCFEIRTLLHGILGMTRLLLETRLTAEQDKYAREIRDSGDALVPLVNNLLAATEPDVPPPAGGAGRGPVAGPARRPAGVGAAPPAMVPGLDPGLAGRLPLRILVAEDNPVNQKLIRGLLGRLGYHPDLARNGREAVEAVERQSYDIVLMDVQMPELDGLEAARRIRQRRPAGAGPRIIALTADIEHGDRKGCLDAGMDDCLSKPCRPTDLQAALLGWGRRGREPGASPAAGPAPEEPSAHGQLDWDAALGYVGGDRRLLRDMIGLYLEKAPRWRAELREALLTGNSADLKRAAHNIKGSMSHFGTRAAFEAARRLEELARGGMLSEAPAAWAVLERKLVGIEPSLKAFGTETAEGGARTTTLPPSRPPQPSQPLIPPSTWRWPASKSAATTSCWARWRHCSTASLRGCWPRFAPRSWLETRGG